MATPAPPDRVKLLAALLWADESALQEALALLAGRWSPIDYEGGDRPFDLTDYYEAEMGKGLKRRIVSFTALVPPEALVEAKHSAGEIEEKLRLAGKRRVNIDPGYMDSHKLVLASSKHGGQKIYLGKGVYADMVARYSRGRFQPFEWSFADFRDGRYDRDLIGIRERYKAELRIISS